MKKNSIIEIEKKGVLIMDEEKKEIVEVEKVDNTENTDKTKAEPKKEVKVETTKKEEPKKERKGFCIAAMVLGIIALVFFCIWYLSIPCAILAIIFGILGINTNHKGMAIAGLVTGIIGIVIWSILIILVFLFGFTMGIFDSLENDYDSYKDYYNHSWYDYD